MTLRTALISFKEAAFRLEHRASFAVPSEQAAFAAFRAGHEPEVFPEHQDWLDLVRAHTRASRIVTRARIIDEPLTDYQRFELEWAYPLNSRAGEQIVILPRSEFDRAVGDATDFWLLDTDIGFILQYDVDDAFVEARRMTPQELGRYSAIRDATIAACIPFDQFSEHPHG